MVKGLTIWDNNTGIVLGIDIGATQSAVAFSHLHKGDVASVQRVGQWPGNQQGEVKIPTQIYYDSKGEPVKIGAETLQVGTAEAKWHGWHLVKHFKLHLHPEAMKHNLTIEALPNNVTLMKIYVDFMRYLLKHTRAFFEDYVSQGKSEWKQYSPSMKVVIAHPNGWGVNEQGFLRRAAVGAGYTTSQKASSQIQFVSEAEASIHFCILYTNSNFAMKPGDAFVVCDAGGSTVDITVYGVKVKDPSLELGEERASDCIQAGGILVDQEAERYFRWLLQPVDLQKADQYVAKGMQVFQKIKKDFSGDKSGHQTIAIADYSSSDTSLGIERGKTKLENNVIKSFFKAPIDAIIRSMEYQISGLNIKGIFVVGGFGQSPYLRTALERRFKSADRKVHAVNDENAKAVADGAVMWFLKTVVTSRAPRFSYGAEILERHDSGNIGHEGRTVFSVADGHLYVPGRWSEIAPQGVAIHTNAAARQSYVRKYKIPEQDLSDHRTAIYMFTPLERPKWLKNTNDNLNPGFEDVCTVRANLNGLRGQLKKKRGRHGSYWELSYNIGIRFGRTELEAFVEWDEEGETRTSKATIIPNSLK